MTRDKTLRRVAARGAAALIAISCVSISSGNADDKAAHDLAQRFVGGSDAGQKQPKPKAPGLSEADRKAQAPIKTKVSPKKVVEPESTDLKSEEDDMLKRARLEAEERREALRKAAEQEEAEDRRREAEVVARKAEEERLANEARIAKEAEEKRVADEKRLAAELRNAEEAAEQRKAEEEHRLADEKRLADKKRFAEEQRLADEKRRAEEQRLAAEQRIVEEKRIAEEKRADTADCGARVAAEAEANAMQEATEKRLAEQRLRVLERDREEEARRLTAKLNRVNEERMKREAEANKPEPAPPSPQPSQTYSVASEPKSVTEQKLPPTETAAAPARSLGHVTILLVMDSGTNGIRRFGKKTADPVICAGQSCWASAGPDHEATAMPRGKALGPGNTLGRRAGACNQSLTCVFRKVDLGSNPQALQPIDLRVMRHDRREPLTVAASGRCELAGTQLYCADTFKSRTWRAWIVPESVAESAGPDKLKAAVKSGLSSAQAADLRATLQQ